jgi:hypothetical protein
VLHEPVPVSTLDNIIGNRFDTRQLLVKIDVEGAEVDVLLGAQRTMAMKPAPRWLIEICLTEHHPDGCNPHYVEVFGQMFDYGFAAYSVESGMRPVSRSDIKRWFENRARDFGHISFYFEKTQVEG